MITVKLDKIESAALEVMAKHERMTPDHLLRDLIRDAAINLITGRPRRPVGDVAITTDRATEARRQESSDEGRKNDT